MLEARKGFKRQALARYPARRQFLALVGPFPATKGGASAAGRGQGKGRHESESVVLFQSQGEEGWKYSRAFRWTPEFASGSRALREPESISRRFLGVWLPEPRSR